MKLWADSTINKAYVYTFIYFFLKCSSYKLKKYQTILIQNCEWYNNNNKFLNNFQYLMFNNSRVLHDELYIFPEVLYEIF